MNLLQRYVCKQLVGTILLVLVCFLALDLFLSMMGEMRLLGKGTYDFSTMFLYVMLTIPRQINLLFPWAALIGTLLTLGQLAAKSELIAMQVARVSVLRIASWVLKVIVGLLVLMLLITEGIGPHAEQWANKIKVTSLSGGNIIRLAGGTWMRTQDEFIHVSHIDPDGKLKNLTRYKLNHKGGLAQITTVQAAEQTDKNTWVLEGIRGTRFLGHKTERIEAEREVVHNFIDRTVLKLSALKYLDRLPFTQLWKSIQYRKGHHLSTRAYELAFWAKLFHPIEILIMVLLAVPFIFGPLRQSSMTAKILTGLSLGFGFYLLNAIFSPLTQVFQWSPLLVAALPSLLCVGLGFYLFRKV